MDRKLSRLLEQAITWLLLAVAALLAIADATAFVLGQPLLSFLFGAATMAALYGSKR